MYAADPLAVKLEPAQSTTNGQDLQIKPDPDAFVASPGPQIEEDIFEDAGDLDFSGAEQGLFLAKVPKFLYERWSNLTNDEEIHIGTVRVEGALDDIKRVRLVGPLAGRHVGNWG